MSVENLDVLLNGKHVGRLSRTKKGMQFQFCDEVIDAHRGSPMLSTAFPVRSETYDARATFAWFSGLLPEETRLKEVQRFFGLGEGDYFGTLREIGWECAGAVEVLPSGFSTACDTRGDESAERVVCLPLEDIASRLKALPSHPYDNSRTMRTSLGGFQEKLCVVFSEADFVREGIVCPKEAFLPLDGSPTTHILKPQPERFPGMVEGEAWAMAVASRVTSAARTALLQLPDMPQTLVVERFDRVRAGAIIQRIHQEDCAQALGLDPGLKYAAASSPKKSDPTYRAIAELLTRYAVRPLEEKAKLLRYVFVNVIMGNTDAHAKNYAFLHPDERTITLAPLYDIVPACEITPAIVAMGMRVDGRIRIDRIGAAQLEAEAQSWGLPKRIVVRELEESSELIRLGIQEASSVYPCAGERHTGKALERLKSFWS